MAVETQGAGRRRRLSPEERRSQLLDSALRVFLGRDPAEVTFEEVALDAGVSRALVYNYFGDKGGLLAELYERCVAGLDERTTAAMVGEGSAEERLRKVVEIRFDEARSDPQTFRFVRILAVTPQKPLEDARRARAERLGEAWGGGRYARLAVSATGGLIDGALGALLDDGAIDDDRNVEIVFRLLWVGLSRAFERAPEEPVEPLEPSRS